jgi:hypothetical protein
MTKKEEKDFAVAVFTQKSNEGKIKRWWKVFQGGSVG